MTTERLLFSETRNGGWSRAVDFFETDGVTPLPVAGQTFSMQLRTVPVKDDASPDLTLTVEDGGIVVAPSGEPNSVHLRIFAVTSPAAPGGWPAAGLYDADLVMGEGGDAVVVERYRFELGEGATR